MPISRRNIIHDGPGGPFESIAIVDGDGGGARPGLLLFPNVLGIKESDCAAAERLAALGYAVLVADVYGQGKRATRQDADPGRFMKALLAGRTVLRDRAQGALAVLSAMEQVDPARVGAVGYCFGGKCVLDLARSGAAIGGGVSFHGVYDPPPFPNAKISAKLLICHGWDDPIAPPEATLALAQELTASGCDWQIHAYGHTGHAFTDESAQMPEKGLAYNATADRRSWKAMVDFLAETLGD